MSPTFTAKLEDYFASPVKRGDDGRMYQLQRTSPTLVEAATLSQLINTTRARNPLEIGLALGASAVAIAEALQVNDPSSRHVVLDPFEADFGNVGLRELDRLGLGDTVEFHAEHSEDFLQTCIRANRFFDFIFNDGAHSIGDKVTNTFYADRCLAAGGIMAFHDAFLPSTVASVRYLVQERSYEIIRLVPDSQLSRLARVVRYGFRHGLWYGVSVVSATCRSLVATQKPSGG